MKDKLSKPITSIGDLKFVKFIKSILIDLWKFILDIRSFIFCLNVENIPFSKTGKWISENKNFFLISVILIIFTVYFLYDVQNIIDFFTINLKVKVLIIPILYLICRIYWNWIKNLWKFVKTDSIIRYLVFIMIPIAIIVISYHFWFRVPNLSSNSQSIDITIDQLNGFYASLFTAIAVLVGIAGLSAWNTVKKLQMIEDKVNFLHEKRDLANWARELFDNDENDISSTELKLSVDDKKKMNRVKEYMTNEITDDSWLEIVLAKHLIDEAKKKNKKKNLDKAIQVFKFIENRDLLDEKSNIEAVLYHMLGQAHQEQYKFDSDKDETKNKLLISSKKYYKKAIDCDEHRDETQGNLAVVLIELAKLNNNNKKENYLGEAAEHLNRVISLNKETYNTYYDLARAKYLENNNEEETKKYLFKSVEKINSIKQKNKFIEFLEKDDILKKIENWCDILEKIKTEINKKRWLK